MSRSDRRGVFLLFFLIIFFFFFNLHFFSLLLPVNKRVSGFLPVHFYFLLFARQKEIETNQRQRKTRKCLGRSAERMTKLMSLAKLNLLRNLWSPSVTLLRYVVVRIVTSTVCPKDTIGRARDLGECPNHPFNLAAISCIKRFCVSFFFWFSFLLSLPQKQRKKKMNKKKRIFI